MSWRAPGAHALPDCIDCGYPLDSCVCVAGTGCFDCGRDFEGCLCSVEGQRERGRAGDEDELDGDEDEPTGDDLL